MHSGVLAKKDQPLCTSLYRLCASVLTSPVHPPSWLDPDGTARSVSETRVPVLLTPLSGHICLAVVPNSWDYEEVPFPACQRRCYDCHPSPRQVPPARARPQRCAALHELRGAFPGTLLSLGPKRGDSSGWGSWFREGLDWFGCFKIGFFSSVVLMGEMGIELQCETWVDGKVKYWSFYYFFLLCYCYHLSLS